MSYNAKISAIEANSNLRSLCWHFFEKKNKKNICKICKKRICTKYGVTSNLRSHLQRKHEKIWNACLKNHVNKDISTTNDHMDEDNKDNISDEIAKTMLYYSRISEAYKSTSRESVIDSKPMCKIHPLQKVPINTKHSAPAIIYIKSEGSDEEIEPPHQKETTIELSNTAKPQRLQANSSFVKKYISNKRSRPTSSLHNRSRVSTTVRPGSSVSRTSINSVSRDESCDDLGTYIASKSWPASIRNIWGHLQRVKYGSLVVLERQKRF
ncbi:hypothetical protein CEXT_327281 [Caerostris extrusa]|uniref:BED-type domain-containing protein n=1 Tax=Caerostris extrusa TaxID=172846 RepID=A0AAV4PGX2_CAEEX|nr:hypothetical protein CEXT_327281 [Caerostris extrusa]